MRRTAKIPGALLSGLGRVSTQQEVEQAALRPRGRHQAVLGRPHWRQEQRRTGQLAIF